MRKFESYNPYIILLHFVLIIGICMLVMHPVIQAISLICGLVYCGMILGKKKLINRLLFLVPVMVITMVINPLFNHRGVTVLGYFPSGNPLTLESALFGVFSGVMLASVICWFSCFNSIFKSDKILYVLGRIAPSVSLVLSMTLRFVPRFLRHAEDVLNAQKALGRDIKKGSIADRLGIASDVLSAMTSWSLENSVETANSMKCRGFGTGKRTFFSIFSFDKNDGLLLVTDVILFIVFIVAYRNFDFSYYPVFDFSVDLIGAVVVLVYGVICLMPVLIDFLEVRRWK